MKATFRKTGRSTSRRSNSYKDGAGAKSRVLAALMPVFAALAWMLMVGSISLGLLYSYRWMTRSPFFSLETITVQGNHYLGDAEVAARAGLHKGQNVLELNIAGIQARLTADPWVETARIRRVLPGTLILTLREREAAFWVRSGNALYYADSRGERIGPVTAGKFISLPFLVMESGDERDRQTLAELVRQLQGRHLPFSDREVAWVQLGPGGGLSLFLEDQAMEVVLDGGNLPVATAQLRRVWKDLRARNELGRVRGLSVMGDKAWVELASG
jgi:cell division protein FtsQ